MLYSFLDLAFGLDSIRTSIFPLRGWLTLTTFIHYLAGRLYVLKASVCHNTTHTMLVVSGVTMIPLENPVIIPLSGTISLPLFPWAFYL